MQYFSRHIQGRWVTVELKSEEIKAIMKRSLDFAIKLQNKINAKEECKELTEAAKQNIFIKNCPSLYEFLNDYVTGTCEKYDEVNK